MTKKDALSVCLFLATIVGIYFFAKSGGNPCARRISYKSISVNNGINWDSLFAEPTPGEIQNTLDRWRERPLEARQVEVVSEFKGTTHHQLRIVSHFVGGQKHYGALFLPNGYEKMPSGSLPVLIFAYGLDQRHPEVQVYSTGLKQVLGGLDTNTIVVVPSFRGQSLRLRNYYYCSDGFFGDAFDGATDDALALLNVCLASMPAADTSRITVMGGSRGGTVALLAGIRDPRIKLVVDYAGPTNFLSRKVHSRYRKQYKYQFLGVKAPIPELRERILASSPYHFSKHLPDVMIVHGAKDAVVPLEQAEILVDRLRTNGHAGELTVDIKANYGHDLGGFGEALEKINNVGK